MESGEQTTDSSLQQPQEIGPAKLQVLAAFATAAPGLAQVEERIRSCLVSDAPRLKRIPEYLLDQGGKRVRPTLALLAARMLGQEEPSAELIDVAAGIELIHMATLLHDDIIDESPTRRHKRSAYLEFGLMPSLLAGDFLLVRAFGLCARLDTFIIESTETACIELTEGEILEGVLDGTTERSFEDYLMVVGKKTASLFGLAGAVGAHLATKDAAITESLRSFGYYAGIAFQMVDDILDVTADEDLLGKPAGTDLKQKTPSLVNILWLASGDASAKEFFSRERISREEARAAMNHLTQSSVIDESRTLAHEYAEKARTALSRVVHPDCDDSIRAQLLAIVDYTLERCR